MTSETDPLGLGLKPTKRQIEVLRLMRDKNEDLVYACGSGYVGLHSVGRRVVNGLLRLVAIRADSFNRPSFERYTINETGRAILMKFEE